MTVSTTVVIALVLVAVVWGTVFGGRAPGQYWHRSCRGRDWKRRFPGASKHEIRKFLSTFAEGFAFREREKLKFGPDDELLRVYRAIYPRAWGGDALEFETLGQLIETRYGISLAGVWRDDLTLGQLFQVTRQR